MTYSRGTEARRTLDDGRKGGFRRRMARAAMAVAAVVACGACQEGTVFDEYVHTPRSGWERNDTVLLDVPRMARGGTFAETVGVRIGEDFPYQGLTLVVEQRVVPGNRRKVDTLRCRLADKDGNFTGSGVGIYQYDFYVGRMELQQGDSLHVSIRHAMQRERMPAISDIGFRLSATDARQ